MHTYNREVLCTAHGKSNDLKHRYGSCSMRYVGNSKNKNNCVPSHEYKNINPKGYYTLLHLQYSTIIK